MKIDGREVRCWLFCRMSRLSVSGAQHAVLYQVEAFTLDHAWKRMLEEIAPGFKRSEIEMLEELDASHDVGKMGTKHPLNPLILRAPRLLQ